jgi:aspartate/tyrosine/aromatic aminotransferase
MHSQNSPWRELWKQKSIVQTSLEIQSYKHYAPETGGEDWESVTEVVSSAPQGSILVLQACYHNPLPQISPKE